VLHGRDSVNCMKPFPQTSSQDVVLRVMKFGALHFPDVVVTDGPTEWRVVWSRGIEWHLRLSPPLSSLGTHVFIFVCCGACNTVTVLPHCEIMTLCNK